MSPTTVRFRALLLVSMIAGLAAASPAVGATEAASHGSGVSSHFVLPAHTLVSGATERGTLVVGNHTGHAIQWNCGYLEVQLVNAHHPLAIHPTPCAPGKTFPVGTTRLRFTLRAALPPGTYRTELFPGLPAVVHPNPITVRVVAKASPTR